MGILRTMLKNACMLKLNIFFMNNRFRHRWINKTGGIERTSWERRNPGVAYFEVEASVTP
jgi:hypothetical protein